MAAVAALSVMSPEIVPAMIVSSPVLAKLDLLIGLGSGHSHIVSFRTSPMISVRVVAYG